MTLQPIVYHGRTLAAATPQRFFLADELNGRPHDDPERRFVIYMCDYAGCVLRGTLPGPYRDIDARRYARACLIPAELLERPTLGVERAAAALAVPVVEIRTELHLRSCPPQG